MRDPEMRRRLLARGRRRDRADAPVPRSRARVPVRRPARLRAGAREQRRRHRAGAGPLRDGSVLRRADGGRRPQARDASVAQLLRLLARPGARRCCRTRRPRGVSATAARTAARPATRARPRSCSRTGRATASHDQLPLEFVVNKMTARDRRALRPRRPRRARAGHARRRQRHRLRRARACRCPSWCTTCPADAPPLRAGLRGLRRDGQARHGDPARRRRPGRAPRPAAPRRAPSPSVARRGCQIISTRITTSTTLSAMPAAACRLPSAWICATCGGGPPTGGGPCSISSSSALIFLWPGNQDAVRDPDRADEQQRATSQTNVLRELERAVAREHEQDAEHRDRGR